MTSADYIARLRSLDPEGTCRVVSRTFDAPGADGEFVDEPADPEAAWMRVDRGVAPNGRSWSFEVWCRQDDEGAVRVIVI